MVPVGEKRTTKISDVSVSPAGVSVSGPAKNGCSKLPQSCTSSAVSTTPTSFILESLKGIR